MSEITREKRPNDSDVPPLDPSLLSLSDVEREFLRSEISADEDELHQKLFQVQKESYELFPYPCIRFFRFVRLLMRENKVYPRVLDAGKQGNTLFLDLGCCIGTDARKLVHDGYPASNVLACDLRQAFIDIGFNLYQDRGMCKINFFPSDIFGVPISAPKATRDVPASEIKELAQLRDKVTHFYIGAFFHLFDEPTQYAIALRIALLLKRDTGAVVFGRHQGLEKAGSLADYISDVRFGHSPESWTRLWKKVFTELEGEEFAGKRVIVDAFLEESLRHGVLSRMICWSVRII